MEDSEKSIKFLENSFSKLVDIKEVNHSNKNVIEGWKSATLTIVERIFGSNSQHVKAISDMHLRKSMVSTGSNSWADVYYLDEFKKCASDIINSMTEEIKGFGLPEKPSTENKNGISIINKISQHQHVELNLIFDAIRDELPPVKFKEMQEIAESDEPKEGKLQKIKEILQKTGIEVVSSTLAKVIGQTMGIQ